MKFYKYVIYRVYSFFLKKDSTPVADTVIVMSVVHLFQIMTIGLYISALLDFKLEYIPKGNPIFYLIIFAIFFLYYIIVFYNGKWKDWNKEFKKEPLEDRRKNGIKVWLFCWGSIILFFISLPVILLI